jgi:hypothetical protein
VIDRSGEQLVVLPSWQIFTRHVAVPSKLCTVVCRPSFGVLLIRFPLR